MTDIGRTVAPDVLVAGGQDLDGLLGPLVAYLDALEARVGALERRLSAVPLMTAADAARVRPGQCGDDPARGPGRRALGGRLCRPLPPDLSRCPQRLACHEIIRGGTGFSAAPPASRYEGKRCRRGGMAGAGLNVARQLAHGGPAPPGHLRSRDGRARPRAEARGGRRDHAGAQRPASGASGLDRIVGMMTASGPYDTLPSNGGRGATMGPPGCTAQSSPVAFRCALSRGLQGLSASWGDWRGQKVFLIRKRSQVRVLDRPLAGIQEFAAFAQFSRIWLLEGRHGRGVPWGHNGATGGYL